MLPHPESSQEGHGKVWPTQKRHSVALPCLKSLFGNKKMQRISEWELYSKLKVESVECLGFLGRRDRRWLEWDDDFAHDGDR